MHKDEVNAQRRKKYHERIGHGKCPRCGGRTKKGRTLCTDCCEYMLNLNRKYAKRSKTAAKSAKATKAKGRVAAKKAPQRKAR